MAFQIFWKIQFKALRSNILYTVNVYKDGDLPTYYPLSLKGGAKPFVTEEDNNDDTFTALRTQSGYIRIVDDGYALNSAPSPASVPFDWKDLMPSTDTDRPVTLTHEENGVTITDWQGFIQAQNFGSVLFDNPQEREFPVQCALATLSMMDIIPNDFNGTKNFAALLDYALDNVPCLNFTTIIIQCGASDARTWMLKKFDWFTFSEENNEGQLEGKCDIQEAIKGMCRYWGWEMRTHGNTIHMNCVDDAGATNFLVLTRADLEDLASGTSAGTIDTDGYDTESIGNIFASTNNIESNLRGYNKATINSDGGEIDSKIIFAYPRPVLEWMYNSGFTPYAQYTEYSNNNSEFSTDLMEGIGPSGTLCLRRMMGDVDAVIRVLSTSISSQSIRFRTKRIHNYKDGFFEIKGSTGRDTARNVVLRLYVGDLNSTYGNTMYWNGTEWNGASSNTFTATVGSDGTITGKIPTTGLTIPEGYVTVHFIKADGEVEFDIENFELTFQRNDDISQYFGREASHEYKAKNITMAKNEWGDDTIFATDNYNVFGAGVVLNPDDSYFGGWDYTTHQEGTTKPEQHLADRVVAFTNVSRLMIKCQLRNDQLPVITPHYKMTLDSETLYPFAISHDWRDSIITLNLIEL